MVIGSGPIVIGQAAEFDYAGTQACLALREEGYEVILVNSNPATIMTDTNIADKVYMEPLRLEYVAKIIRYERPDAIVPSLGGQTGLNLAVQLAKKGVLEECDVEILGTSFESIERAEDRELFKELCESLGEPVLPSIIANNMNLLSGMLPSFDMQIRKAESRGDRVSVNHRVAEFLASYFDVIFALNEMTHPGEKRMQQICTTECEILPEHFNENLNRLFAAMFREPVFPVIRDMLAELQKII